MPEPVPLKRCISLTSLTFYGLGTMVGGGFYALLGRVVELAGPAGPLALGLSGALALLSATSFAELSSRFPVSAGEVRYVQVGFGSRTLAVATGWLVILTGIVSAATLTVATTGFLRDLIDIPESLTLVSLVFAMGAVAAWGVGASVGIVFTITVIEVGALIIAVVLTAPPLEVWQARLPELLPQSHAAAWTGIGSGVFLAFYAFLGFEDMVNMAEEVRQPKRNLPIAIFISVVATTLLYVCVGATAVLAIPVDELAASRTPVARMVSSRGPYATTGFGIVSLLTGVNGALVQIIMSARVAYGLGARNLAPHWLARVHPRTRTPLVATLLLTGVTALLALYFPLTTLARATSSIILVIFATVNLALWRVKVVDPDPGGEGPRFPVWLPIVGACSCVGILMFQGWTMLTP